MKITMIIIVTVTMLGCAMPALNVIDPPCPEPYPEIEWLGKFVIYDEGLWIIQSQVVGLGTDGKVYWKYTDGLTKNDIDELYDYLEEEEITEQKEQKEEYML